MITKKLVDEIVERTMFRLDRNLKVMDTNGMILAAGEKNASICFNKNTLYLMYKFHVKMKVVFIHGGGFLITKKLADEIVERKMFRLNGNLNVMDTNGMILASGEKERIDMFQ